MFFVAPILVVGLGLLAVKRQILLSVVPDALDVHGIVYEKEARWGLPLLALPGDNETGLRVYRLPDAIATQARDGGTGWLEAMRPNSRSSSAHPAGVYTDWHETPLDTAARRHVTATYGRIPGDCGFCIQVDTGLWAQVRHIIDTPGSFYAVGRSGVIVVSPEQRRVIYMFNG